MGETAVSTEQMPILPGDWLEVTFKKTDEFGKRVWVLLADHMPRYSVVERDRWRWEVCQINGDSFQPKRMLELGVTLPNHRIWPTEQAFSQQAEEIRVSCGNWLPTFLPWTPLLICALCHQETTPHRQAMLATLFTALTSQNLPNLRRTRFHLHRLAYLALAEIDEGGQPEVERKEWLPFLRHHLYAWQEEIVREERAGFFAQGLPAATIRPGDPPEKVHSVFAPQNESGVHLLREGAMVNLLVAEGGQLRRLLRDSSWGRNVVRTLIQRWFLPHYDLDMAEQLKRATHTAHVDPDQGGRLGKWSRLSALARWCRRVGLLLIGFYLLLSLTAASGWLPWLPRHWIVTAVYVLGLGDGAHWVCNRWPDTSLPRLRAGILLAVVGTLLQQNWGSLLDFSYHHPLSMLLICGGLLLAAYQVLVVKIGAELGWLGQEEGRVGFRAHLGRLRGVPHVRGRAILGRALFTSFMFSLLLVDLLGSSYVECIPSLYPGAWFVPVMPGLVAGTFPALVILFAAILLFAGIFSQLLWEEKSMTEALA